ncbi:CHAD domain-containing protein [Nocardia sp. SYP-A9097]|uniref:CHAD domain-containing protein n=1 Tax=Nocardia sp. SYP-A9097 TaxID=2663237 RepID=UPI00129BA061|nr:CHAD domain-containing protein [Nocardia sp. SYP-A9097]MRH92042.1 CHAD domain-containing protein [Nocardia sp. SYP-A9097]
MKSTAGPALVDALTADVDRLRAAEPEVRQDLPDSVHKMRVATRRLRSLLRSYRRTLARKPVGELSDELRWLAGLLGVARDAEVRGERFAGLLGENGALFDDKAAPGEKSTPRNDFGARLVAEERARYEAALAEAVAAFDTRRYRTLLGRLRRTLADPPLRSAQADKPADKVFADVLRHDFRDLRRLVRAEPQGSEAERIEHLHEIRKAAKRLRYSAEAATDMLGEPAALLARRAKQLQTVLGDHRDAIEALETLRAHAAAAEEPAFQRLCDAEEAAAAKALEEYPAAIEFLRHHAL